MGPKRPESVVCHQEPLMLIAASLSLHHKRSWYMICVALRPQGREGTTVLHYLKVIKIVSMLAADMIKALHSWKQLFMTKGAHLCNSCNVFSNAYIFVCITLSISIILSSTFSFSVWCFLHFCLKIIVLSQWYCLKHLVTLVWKDNDDYDVAEVMCLLDW